MRATLPTTAQLPAELLALFGVLPGAHLLLSPALVVVAATEAYLTTTHTKRADLLGRPLAAIAAGIGAQYASALRGCLAAEAGTGQPWQLSHVPVPDAQGRVQYLLHTATRYPACSEVAARLQASESRERMAHAAARTQRRRLCTGLQQVPALLAIHHGPQQVFGFVNAQYRQLFAPRQLRGRAARVAVPEVVGQGWWEALDGVYQTGAPFYNPELALQLPTPSGGLLEQRHFHVFCQALRDEQQRIRGVLSFAFDITAQVLARGQVQQLNEELAATNAGLVDYVEERTQELRAALAEAQQQRAQLEALLLAAPVAVGGQLGPGLVQNLVNPSYQALFSGQRLLDLPALAARPAPAAHPSQALNEQLATANTALRQHNQELAETNQQLARTNIDLDSFVYTASHDLQGPISNLEGLLGALREEMPAGSQPAPVAYILELMHDSVTRFRRTLGHLATIARWQAAPAEGPLANPADVVRHVLLDLALPIAEAGAQLTVDVADCPADALAEKNLHSVVYNLVSNALKYRHPDRVPQVSLRCRAEADYWVLAVQDNGLGLALTAGRPLFGLFQRFHTHVEGSGVGLYMVKRIVEHAGGRIEVASEVGVGSTFTVYFRRG